MLSYFSKTLTPNFFLFYLNKTCPGFLKSIFLNKSDLNFFLDKKNLLKLSFILQNHFNFLFESVTDIFALDRSFNGDRFRVIYSFLSYSFSFRIFLNITVSKNEYVDSLIRIYKSSNWLEREIWDMFGIFFFCHPDLRRILTDYGFNGFPLRKDFPLSGYLQFYYDENLKKVSSEPLNLVQNYRNFLYNNPWNS